jgi:hypothetical protein
MFGFLKGKVEKGPPTADVLSFESGSLELRLAKPLAEGSHEVVLKLADGTTVPARVTIESYLKEKDLHWASLEDSPEAKEKLFVAFPAAQAEAEAAAAAAAALVWEEKRSEPRLQRAMGIMSPDVNGFKALTWDLSMTGIRIAVNQDLPVGKTVRLRLELDDHRIPPLDLQAEILWSKAVPSKGFWAGARLINVPEKTTAIFQKFLDNAFSHEDGVLSRDYAAD